MRRGARGSIQEAKAQTFDVVCVGEALWNLAATGDAFSVSSTSLRFLPGGGAVNAAVALSEKGLRVGLATALSDDSFGRALLERIAGAGVNIGGVSLGAPNPGIVLLEGIGSSRKVISFREDESPVSIPKDWQSQVLLLSGLSPVVSRGAALCKAARAARRVGTTVVVDVNARKHVWQGRDPRAIWTVLHEADVVRYSAEDAAVLGLDASIMRKAMRKNGVLAMTNATGDAWAAGPFGEVARAAIERTVLRKAGSGDAFVAALCAELVRAGAVAGARIDVWQRTLDRAQHAAALPTS